MDVGRFPIRQTTMEANTPSVQAFVRAAEALGLARIDDFNGAEQDGVSPYPRNVLDGRRINTGMAYLNEDVRSRPNLAIMETPRWTTSHSRDAARPEFAS